jgi:hypothetical protein
MVWPLWFGAVLSKKSLRESYGHADRSGKADSTSKIGELRGELQFFLKVEAANEK